MTSKKLDSPELREILENTQVEWDGGLIIPDNVDELYEKLLALFPDIDVACVGLDLCCDLEAKLEEALKQERERIIGWLENYDCWNKSAHLLRADIEQALKKGA